MIEFEERFWSHVDKSGECWLWTGATFEHGYGHVQSRGRNLSAHRIAYALTYGEFPAELWVLHRCDNPLCCRPDHLFLGTPADNSQDMIRKGRSATGERNGNKTHPERHARGELAGTSKLTSKQVQEIRSRYASGTVYQRELAKEFGVAQSEICRIVNGKRWAHVVEATRRTYERGD